MPGPDAVRRSALLPLEEGQAGSASAACFGCGALVDSGGQHFACARQPLIQLPRTSRRCVCALVALQCAS